MTSPGITRFYAAAAVLAVIAGVLLFPLATETDRFFSWTIEPPVTAAFLGAAYWAAALLLGWAARRREWASARTALPPVATIAVLLLVTTLIHLDRFDLDSIFGWFWLVVYVCVTPLLAWLVWRQLRDAEPVARGLHPFPGVLRLLLAAQAVILLASGAALLVAPVDAAEIWPWVLTPLTARAVGSFLVGFGVAAAFALWENDIVRLRGVAWAWCALGALELVVAATRSAELDGGSGAVAAYLVFWSLSAAGGAAGVVLASRAKSALASS